MKYLIVALSLIVVAVSAGKDYCESSPCENGGQCYSGLLTYYCKCARGFWGRNCQKKVWRRCDDSPCQNGGECVNKPFFHYKCNCLPGYSGKKCQHAPCDAEPCMNDGVCTNGGAPSGGYSCQCADGYQGDNCQEEVPPSTFNCVDRDPCSPENTAANGFYFPHDEKSKFVQCSEWGQCYEMNCPAGLEWDQEARTCNWP